MTTMTTRTTKGWRSDDSIILLGCSVTLVGPGQYPRYTSAVKEREAVGSPATDKAAKHDRNTTGTRSTPKFSQHAGKVAHITKNDRDQALKKTPENVRIREEAAARCTKVIKRRVLKKQARKKPGPITG